MHARGIAPGGTADAGIGPRDRWAVLGPKGTRHYVDHLFENGAFKVDLMARSAYDVRKKNIEAVRPEVREVAPGLIYQDEHIKVYAEFVEHIPREICECFGVRIEAEGKVLAFSGDTAPCDAMVRLGQDADLLIHECTFPESFLAHRAKSGVGTPGLRTRPFRSTARPRK